MRDLIARVLAEHNVDGYYVSQDGADMWHSWCSCGASETRPPGGDSHAHQHLADAIVAAIEASQPDHLIELRPDGYWVIQHPMACRLTGKLLDCPFVTAGLVLVVRTHTAGRYVCTLDDDGELIIGEAVTTNG